ncbi:MAG: UTP--glucose-1-phosphate uridylyltransferase GalU [Actinomycetota bacterium]
MPTRKGIIPAAGLGTRFLPASKAVPKVLLPVVDRPIIQYAVEEMARAGIEQITIVLSPGQGAIADHFSPAPALEAVLEAAGKADLLAQCRAPEELAEIFFVQQPRPLGLGHAVWCARDLVGDEPFAIVLPDEMFDPQDNFLAELMAIFEDKQASVIAGMPVPHEEICRYGAIECEDPPSDPARVVSLVEKPPVHEARSDVAIVGRYVLDPRIFDMLAKLEPGAVGEIQLTDALNVLALEGSLYAKRYAGRRWDVGNKLGFLRANFDLAADRPELAAAFSGFRSAIRSGAGA